MNMLLVSLRSPGHHPHAVLVTDRKGQHGSADVQPTISVPPDVLQILDVEKSDALVQFVNETAGLRVSMANSFTSRPSSTYPPVEQSAFRTLRQSLGRLIQ
jgi:hypothetical protein